jgi:hypothetical protein
MRFFKGAMIFGCLAAAAQVADKPGAPAPTQSVSAAAPMTTALPRRVTVLLSAMDKSGSPLKDLTKDSISVVDNDQTGQILDVRNAGQLPMDLAIVLLASKGNFAQQQNAAVDLIHKAIRPGIDKAIVVTAGGENMWPSSRLEWQSDAATLEKTIRQKNSWVSSGSGNLPRA